MNRHNTEKVFDMVKTMKKVKIDTIKNEEFSIIFGYLTCLSHNDLISRDEFKDTFYWLSSVKYGNADAEWNEEDGTIKFIEIQPNAVNMKGEQHD